MTKDKMKDKKVEVWDMGALAHKVPARQKYEVVIVSKPFLPDQVRIQDDKKFVDLLKEKKGELLHKNTWGKRYLAYKIQGHNEGYYVVYNVEIGADKIDLFTEFFNRSGNIIRYLLVNQKDNPVKINNPDK